VTATGARSTAGIVANLVDSGVVTIPEVLRRAALLWPGLEAVVLGEKRLSFGDVAQGSREVARSLIAHGVAAGDRIAIWAPNSVEWYLTVLGLYRVGAVLVPLNTRYRSIEIQDILSRAHVRVAFAAGEFLGTDHAATIADIPGAPLDLVVALSSSSSSAQPWEEFRVSGSASDDEELDRREAALTYDSTSDVLFTSGTTGSPKGAMLRHGATVQAFDDYGTMIGLRPGDRMLCIPPFFHGFGLKAGIVAALCKGATLLPVQTFDADRVADLIESERVTVLPGPPTVFQGLLGLADGGADRFATLRCAVTGSARMPEQTLTQAKERLGLDSLITGYGLTEATAFCTHNGYSDDLQTNLSTVGRAAPGVEIRIVREDGQDAKVFQAGEILVRGYCVMKGYFEDPVATAAAIDDDNWLHTGDVGILDDDGRLRVTDRLKDVFIVGGFNAYPAEIEKLLLAHQSILDAAVIGVPDVRLGEVGEAYVIVRDGHRLSGGDVITYARENMANFKVPRTVHIVDSLPRNASGKVLKHELGGHL
jgi:acyl-CoA synthetase (AMP-forming)/AMP-acid ligase II